VKIQQFRKIVWAALLLSAVFAAWSWFRPFEWGSDPAARSKVIGVQLTRDGGFFWIDTHLKVSPGETHDLQKPVYLTTAEGLRIEPADTVFGGERGPGTTDLWFKFWLRKEQLAGPITLHLNDGKLSIRAKSGRLDLADKQSKYFSTHLW
jgi:hypothetical protein